jgi:hypothetical protein
MKVYKYFQYVYLVFAGFFFYDAITKYLQAGTIEYPSLLLGTTAVFVFFFRRKFNDRFDNKDSQK